MFLYSLESPCSSHSESLSDDMSNESNDGSLTKNEHRSLDFDFQERSNTTDRRKQSALPVLDLEPFL